MRILGGHSINLKSIGLVLCFLLGGVLVGCGASGSGIELFSVEYSGFHLGYNGNVVLQGVHLNDEDLNEITALYQETGDNVGYVDSLLIAEKYSKGLGINTFVQENLDTMINQGLKLDDINKTQISVTKKNKKINGVLVEYKISEGFISSVPLLYVSQLFIMEDENVVLFSYITENLKSRSSASNMFKNIK